MGPTVLHDTGGRTTVLCGSEQTQGILPNGGRHQGIARHLPGKDIEYTPWASYRIHKVAYIKLLFAHVPGMPGTFSPPLT